MKKLTTFDLILVSLFAAVTAALTFVSIPIPFSPFPITGQTFGVMLSGALLGPKLGPVSQLVYLLLGSIGLPVFANGTSGVGVLFGASGGFLLGFPIGAYIIGKLIHKKRDASLFYISSSIIVGGILAVYFTGIAQLSRFIEGGLSSALLLMLLYVPGDILKTAGATFVYKALKSHKVSTLLNK